MRDWSRPSVGPIPVVLLKTRFGMPVTELATDRHTACQRLLLCSLRLPDEVDEEAALEPLLPRITAFSGAGCWPAGEAMRGTCLPGHWLKSYATAVAVASLAWLAGPEEARGFDLFGLFRSPEAPPSPNPDNLV